MYICHRGCSDLDLQCTGMSPRLVTGSCGGDGSIEPAAPFCLKVHNNIAITKGNTLICGWRSTNLHLKLVRWLWWGWGRALCPFYRTLKYSALFRNTQIDPVVDNKVKLQFCIWIFLTNFHTWGKMAPTRFCCYLAAKLPLLLFAIFFFLFIFCFFSFFSFSLPLSLNFMKENQESFSQCSFLVLQQNDSGLQGQDRG